MKLSTLMAGYSPSALFQGEVMANDWVLAVDTSESQTAAIGDYMVVQEHIESAESSINSTTNDKDISAPVSLLQRLPTRGRSLSVATGTSAMKPRTSLCPRSMP
jgi:hypothetical protein